MLVSLLASLSVLLLLLPGGDAFFNLFEEKKKEPVNCFVADAEYNSGHVLAETTKQSPEECQSWCQLYTECRYFTFNPATRTCHLSGRTKPYKKLGVVSGPQHCAQEPAQPKEARSTCVGPVCLKGGALTEEGDVHVDGLPVCDDKWGLREGAVVCREMGFAGVKEVTHSSWYGTWAANYSMDEVMCEGNETSLKDCYHVKRNDCGTSEAAGVVCSTVAVELPGSGCYEAGAVCLQGGSFPGEGNVYYQGRPVCDHGWDFPDAMVVCRRLGYMSVANVSIASHFGTSNTFFGLSNLECQGDEVDFKECFHDDIGEGCGVNTVAGVTCSGLIEKLESDAAALPGLIVGVVLLTGVLLGLVGWGVWRMRQRLNKLKPGLEPAGNIYKFKNPMTTEQSMRQEGDTISINQI